MRRTVKLFFSFLLTGFLIRNLLWWVMGYKTLDPLEAANYRTLPYKVEVIGAYDKYYYSVENLLDSLYLPENAAIFRTEVGKCYLTDKNIIDSLTNQERDECLN
jgi:hypothetical protein|uniref:Uncharacterized protein n=1 Tax=Podoviridae sp. ctz6O13 TaxID=2827757 RepID=A0A8S5TL82_9CAUD|nr:MAG TPA: hypothetical protein [Podoviridae sp. ctz6O13]